MNLLSLLADLTKRDPHATIAIDVDPVQPTHVSRSELWRRCLQLRADLATAGVGRGDAVLACLPNASAVLDWYVATASLGALTAVPDVTSATSTGAAEVAGVLARTRPRVVALPHSPDDPDPAAALRAAIAEAGLGPAVETSPALPAVAVVSGPLATPPVDPAAYDVGGGAWLPSATTAGMPMPATRGDEPAVAFAPSLTAVRESDVVRQAFALAEAMGVGDDDAVLCTSPVTTPVGFATAFAALANGATCLLEPGFEAGTVLDDMDRFGATHLAASGSELQRIAGAHGRRPRTLASWRWVGVTDGADEAGARDAVDWARREFGVVGTVLHATDDGFRCD